MNMTLSAIMSDPDMDNEDKINAMCEGKKLLTNASYFAFTATPKTRHWRLSARRTRMPVSSSIVLSTCIP